MPFAVTRHARLYVHRCEHRAEVAVLQVHPIVPDAVQSSAAVMVPQRMPRFFFDLFFDHYVVLDPGGMVFEYATSANAVADQMARHLVWRAELRDRR